LKTFVKNLIPFWKQLLNGHHYHQITIFFRHQFQIVGQPPLALVVVTLYYILQHRNIIFHIVLPITLFLLQLLDLYYLLSTSRHLLLSIVHLIIVHKVFLKICQKKTTDGLKRLPLVVIPKRRKHKNYVSRRRNTQILNSLRRCTSDPNVYKSYNNWKTLCIGVPEQKPLPVILPSKVPISAAVPTVLSKNAVGPKAAAVTQRLTNVPASPQSAKKGTVVIPRPSDIKRRESGKAPLATTVIPPVTTTVLPPSVATNIIVPPPITATSKVVSQAPNAAGATSGISRRLNLRKTQAVPSVDAACAPSTSASNLVSSPPESLPASAVPSPQPPPELPKLQHSAITGRRTSSRRRKSKIDDFATIKRDLIESAAKFELAKKKLSVNDKEESTTSDESKAKKTLNAISAAFSDAKAEQPLPASTLQTGDVSLNVAAKPPTTPSSGRKVITTKPVTPKAKLRNAGPTQPKRTPPVATPPENMPERLPSSDEEDFLRPPELSGISTNIKDVIAQAEAALEDEERVKPPILQLSKQPILPSPVQHPQRFERSRNPQTASLLATLQLPPSVSAKVDKIIASGGKKLQSVSIPTSFFKKIAKFYKFKTKILFYLNFLECIW
jgi:hypothetical protein